MNLVSLLDAEDKAYGTVSKIPFMKRFGHWSRKKRRISAAVLLLVIIIALTTIANGFFMGSGETPEYTEYTVSRGDISVSISGSGTVEPNAQYEVISLVEGDVLEDTFKEGDTVTKGALLYKIDSSDMEKTMEKANISYERSQMSYQDSLESYYGLNVTAPISGRVTEILIEKGDTVQSGTRVAVIADDSLLTAKVAFSINDVGSLYEGQPVNVTLENTFEVLSGHISKIYGSKRVLDGYIEVSDVEITVKNPGALESGTYVTVNAGGIDCYEGAALEGAEEKIVTAKTSGTVSKVYASAGEYLDSGDVIAALTSDSADDDLKKSELSLRESMLSYESTQEQLDEYSITAPISGTVIEKNIKSGDTLESSGSASTVLCVIADMSAMKFTIDVDELDIASMKEGQEVNITADALSNQSFEGYVSNIGLLGTTSDGVTSYPVEIVIENGEDLWPGMNVSAEIVVDSATDVLRIPVSAVNRGNTVLVKGAKETEETGKSGDSADGRTESANGRGASADRNTAQINQNLALIDQSTAPDGSKYVRVTIGLNDESYIEITDGLSEGDVILVPVIQSSGEETTQQQGNTFIMGPGAGGGAMPAGGPPAGGGNYVIKNSGGSGGSTGSGGSGGNTRNSGSGGSGQ